MSDTEVASIGRSLAEALSNRARERTPDAMQEVLRLQTELCRAVRTECIEAALPAAE